MEKVFQQKNILELSVSQGKSKDFKVIILQTTRNMMKQKLKITWIPCT